MGRHELTEEQWRLIKPLLPKNGGKGKQWKSHRRILNGIFWRVKTGVPWRDIPSRYGKWKTIYGRFNRWSKNGTLDRILEALQVRLNEQGLVDWDLWCVDGTNIRATRAAAGARKKGAPTSRPTMLWVAQEADSQPSSTWLLTAKACRLPSM